MNINQNYVTFFGLIIHLDKRSLKRKKIILTSKKKVHQKTTCIFNVVDVFLSEPFETFWFIFLFLYIYFLGKKYKNFVYKNTKYNIIFVVVK